MLYLEILANIGIFLNSHATGVGKFKSPSGNIVNIQNAGCITLSNIGNKCAQE